MLQEITVFRRGQGIDPEIKASRGKTSLGHGSIENRGRDLMTNPAGSDEDRVEVILVVPIESEMATDQIDFGKRKGGVESGAGQDEQEHGNPGPEDFATGRKFAAPHVGIRFQEWHAA